MLLLTAVFVCGAFASTAAHSADGASSCVEAQRCYAALATQFAECQRVAVAEQLKLVLAPPNLCTTRFWAIVTTLLKQHSTALLATNACVARKLLTGIMPELPAAKKDECAAPHPTDVDGLPDDSKSMFSSLQDVLKDFFAGRGGAIEDCFKALVDQMIRCHHIGQCCPLVSLCSTELNIPFLEDRIGAVLDAIKDFDLFC